MDAVAASAAILPSVEFKLTEAEDVADEVDDFEVNEEVREHIRNVMESKI